MNNARSIAFWVVLFLLILALFNVISGGQNNAANSTVSYSDFVARVEGGNVSSATIDGERIVFRGSDGRDYVTIQPEGAGVTDLLVQNDIKKTLGYSTIGQMGYMIMECGRWLSQAA